MPSFDGFRYDDFETLDGSSWRGRDALGGVLARALRPAIGPDCQSWGVRRRVELHIARKSLYDFEDPIPVAKLFVYTYDDLAFGFYVEASAKREHDDHYLHWRNFRDRIQETSALRDALTHAVTKHDLGITDYYHRHDRKSPLGRFRSSKGMLQFAPRETDSWRDSSVSELADAVAALSGDEWVNLHIYASIGKEAAIEMGKDVVDFILPVLDDLVPVYLETIA